MYDKLARFYNAYTEDIDYGKLAGFTEKMFKKYGCTGLKNVAGGKTARQLQTNGENPELSTLVIDVGCGTGKLCFELSDRGYDMTGLDISPEMLSEAKKTAAEKGQNILWLCQDMCKMDMYGSYAAMLCFTDGINHILTEKRLEAFLKRAYNFIDPKGLLIFDFLTEKHFEEVGEEGLFFEDSDNGTCLWTADYDKKKKICTYDIVCYDEIKDAPGTFERFDEQVKEKAYNKEEIEKVLSENGFELIYIKQGIKSNNKINRLYAVARREA